MMPDDVSHETKGPDDLAEVFDAWYAAVPEYHGENSISDFTIKDMHTAFVSGFLYSMVSTVSHETIDDRIARYVAARKDRDKLIKDLTAEGWTVTQIAKALGMGRPTVYRVLGRKLRQDHGHGYTTMPRDVSHETSE